MQSKKIKGMKDIPVPQYPRRSVVQTSQASTVAELAHLEHEKRCLKRDMKLWLKNQEKAARRLQEVEENLAQLRQVFQSQTAEQPPNKAGRAAACCPPSAEADHPENEEQNWQEISLEY